MHSVTSILILFNDTATTEIYTLSLHDALPISGAGAAVAEPGDGYMVEVSEGSDPQRACFFHHYDRPEDRKSTRLNSSHSQISYAVFCLKKKKSTSNKQHSSS